jgi:ABC-type transport system substrate-binding protein
MTKSTKTASLLAARASLGLVVLCFAALGAGVVGDSWGQPPAQKKPRVEEEEDTPKAKKESQKKRVEEEDEPTKAKTPPGKKKRAEEEEETPKGKTKRKIIQIEDDDDNRAKSKTGRSHLPTGDGDLKQLAEQATHPGVQALFRALAVPHDHVLHKASSVTVGGRKTQDEYNAEPIPLYLGNNPERYSRENLTFIPLSYDWKPEKQRKPILQNVESVRPYEQIAQDKVKEFLSGKYDQLEPEDKNYLSSFDMLVAAEQALTAVLRWHESARQKHVRAGEGWDLVEASVRKQLLEDVLLKQMAVLKAAQDWDKMLALTRRLAGTYANSAERERFFRPAAEMVQQALNDPTGSDDKKQQARKRLLELERDYPGNPAFRPIVETLRKQAQSYLDQAKELSKDKSEEKRRLVNERLQQAKETWPDLPELHAFELEWNTEHPILRVGVRGRLPQYFSPAWACTDDEQRVVEMLFESLVKLLPDRASGFQYHPGLAEYRPRVLPLGRQFELPRNAQWSNGTALNATDINFTLKLLQEKGFSVGRSPEWGKLLDTVQSERSPTQLTLRLKQGFLDPLALMTFKILPDDQPALKDVNSKAFAQDPVCSGPFRLDASRHSDENNRECLFFLANPSYGLRTTRRELPHIKEIRLYAYTDAVDELSRGKLDLVLDLTAKEADDLQQKSGDLKVKVSLPLSTVPNRRIYFLAINNKKLANPSLRKALAYAINREALLDAHFRGPLKGVHKALNGPFPVGSWACNPAAINRQGKNGLDLFNEGRARDLSQQQEVRQAAATGPWKLKYPQGDATLDAAMKALCDQVKERTGLVLEPAPLDPQQLREDVEKSQIYDVAYYHYDFPDETYWLKPLLGSPARALAGGGEAGNASREENIFCFADKDLPILLGEATKWRDFAQVQTNARTIHTWLLGKMPFIPLWQLDPLLAHHDAVRPSAWDPQLVFNDIENWRLQRK